MHVAERAVFGTSHAEVGAYLMGLWGFNNKQLAAVCWHHASENLCCEEFSPQLAVHIANSLDHELVKIHDGYAERPLGLQQIRWDELNARLQGWRGVCQHHLDEEAGNE
jgi:HD-like signal output (HDOD) protein